MKAVEALYGVIPDAEAPSAHYLSQKSEETETNEPIASPLDEVVSRKESTTSSIQSSIDSSGHLRVTRTKCKSKMPASTEDYRRVMRVEANAWLCMAARYRAKPWLNGLVASDFTKFVDYILGDRVYGIQLPSSTTEFAQKVKPDWSIVLACEFKLRREVMKLITQHARTMSEALVMVTKDADLKEAFFTTPIALKAAGALEQQPIKYHKGDYKGDFKGSCYKGSGKKGQKGKKGGGKGQMPEALKGLQLVWRTPDNRDLCFAWNAGNKCDDRCSRVHQCRVKGCYGNHKVLDRKNQLLGPASQQLVIRFTLRWFISLLGGGGTQTWGPFCNKRLHLVISHSASMNSILKDHQNNKGSVVGQNQQPSQGRVHFDCFSPVQHLFTGKVSMASSPGATSIAKRQLAKGLSLAFF